MYVNKTSHLKNYMLLKMFKSGHMVVPSAQVIISSLAHGSTLYQIMSNSLNFLLYITCILIYNTLFIVFSVNVFLEIELL